MVQISDLSLPSVLLPPWLCGFAEISCLLLQNAQKRLGTLQDLKERREIYRHLRACREDAQLIVWCVL